jgi:hypothetical protein
MTTRQRWSALLGLLHNKQTKWPVFFVSTFLYNKWRVAEVLCFEGHSAAAITEFYFLHSLINFHLRAILLKSHNVRYVSCRLVTGQTK